MQFLFLFKSVVILAEIILFWFQQKWQHFWKKRGLRNCLLKMNGLYYELMAQQEIHWIDIIFKSIWTHPQGFQGYQNIRILFLQIKVKNFYPLGSQNMKNWVFRFELFSVHLPLWCGNTAYSRLRNKHTPTLINFWYFFQGLRSYYGFKRLTFYYISLHILRGYVYSFCQIFQRLRLFKGLRLFQSLE